MLVSPTSVGVQHMINNLGKYCRVWNLKVKNNGFREEGKLSKSGGTENEQKLLKNNVNTWA